MSYAIIARFYDLLHADLEEDRDFLLQLATEHSGPILELGSGTGRLLMPLANAGHAVVGLERDREMLAIARKKQRASPVAIREKLTLIEGDARQFQLQEQFGLIVIAHNTFMHFDQKERRRVLVQAGSHLLPEGRLVIDVANPNEVVAGTVEHLLHLERNELLADSGERLLQFSASAFDDDQQLLRVTWIFDLSPAEGGAVRRYTTQTDYHLLYAHQLELLLADAGLELVEALGDYQGAPYEAHSPRLIVIARQRDDGKSRADAPLHSR